MYHDRCKGPSYRPFWRHKVLVNNDVSTSGQLCMSSPPIAMFQILDWIRQNHSSCLYHFTCFMKKRGISHAKLNRKLKLRVLIGKQRCCVLKCFKFSFLPLIWIYYKWKNGRWRLVWCHGRLVFSLCLHFLGWSIYVFQWVDIHFVCLYIHVCIYIWITFFSFSISYSWTNPGYC